MIILCASSARKSVGKSGEGETKSEMETDGDKQADKARVKERVQKIKLHQIKPTKLYPPLIRAGSSKWGGRCNQRAEAGKHKPPVVFITLTQQQAILLAAAMHSAEATTSLHHVNQQHSLWTVADNYSNCQRRKTYNSSKIKLYVCALLDIHAFRWRVFLHSGACQRLGGGLRRKRLGWMLAVLDGNVTAS